MIAQVSAPRIVASPATARAAKNAAKSPHGLINLIRLVRSLDASSLDFNIDEEDEEVERAKITLQAKKDEQTAAYAQIMLNALREGNEGSSNTAAILDDLEKTLADLEDRYAAALAPRLAAIPLSKTLSRVSATSSKAGNHTPASIPSRPTTPAVPHNPPQTAIPTRRSPSPPPQTLRKRKNPPLSTYLQTRSAEDAKGSEFGLLPIRNEPILPPEKSNRDQLLGASGVGMGAAQLHEELGGQLADMSHRLRLNAIHFSNSLEAEKAILETSQETLENNLTATLSSKKTLSAVSKKSKGTTCMTLGIVLLVLIIFFWTYMLIRFT